MQIWHHEFTFYSALKKGILSFLVRIVFREQRQEFCSANGYFIDVHSHRLICYEFTLHKYTYEFMCFM